MNCRTLLALAGLVLTIATVPSTISVPLVDERGVLFFRATVNGAGPMLFTFDPGGEDVYTSYARSRLDGHTPNTVCLATACFPAPLHYLDGDPNDVDPKHDARTGVIAGSIGPALLRRYVVTIDYRALTLTLVPVETFRAPSGSVRLPLTVDAYGMPVVPAAIDGIDAPVELDVRVQTSMLFAPFLERTGLGAAYAGSPVVKRTSSMVARAIRSVKIGGSDVRDAAFWFSTERSGKFADANVAGLLGNDVLGTFTVTIDLVHGAAYLSG